MKRFIPTPVGNARALSRPRRRAAVHPHARGERHGFSAGQRKRVGSSPRPWGTRKHYEATPQQVRFIPTPVGNARPTAASSAPAAVHPHARGERLRRFFRATNEGGSSPRPWGTPIRPGPMCPRSRFIPTPVGNAQAWRCGSRSCSVHPHARGERFERPHRPGDGNGSSPRPWGTRLRPSPHALLSRFIPTPVGNATTGPCAGSGLTVHPHARGERVASPAGACCRSGSSPRPWGTRDTQQAEAQQQRFIPTPVGNAAVARRKRAEPAVHPHARGER